MSFRGSENALWDYANFNEECLGNQSVICHPAELGREGNPVYAKWKSRFPLKSYRSRRDLTWILGELGAGAFYQIKAGPFDGFLIPGVKNCVHAMFLCDEFHGDRYAYVSAWASRVMTGEEKSYVPHFVPRLKSGSGLRNQLGIPSEARVFGRHGGWDTFNIPWIRDLVRKHARRHPGDHFVFLNTEPIQGTQGLANVHYLPATADAEKKASFLATCDAMLHARWHGETFGLAVGEFAVLGKPVITFGGSRERAHLEMLGDQGLVYGDQKGCQKILERFARETAGQTGYHPWTEAPRLMAVFKERFLD